MMAFLFLIFILVILLVFAIAVYSVKFVKQQTALIVERFGKYNRTLNSGINFIIPFVETIAAEMPLFLQDLDLKILAITSDKVTVDLHTTLIYQVMPDKVATAYYSVGDPHSVMKSVIENSIRSYVAKHTHEEILQKRDDLTYYLKEHLNEKFEEWGRTISSFQVRDVKLPAEITDAMSKVVASKRLREAAEYEAEAKKILKVREAEAERESRRLAGLGVAEERQAIVDGLKASVENMHNATGVDMTEIMNVVMLTQYVDALKSLGSNSNSKVVFLSSNPGSLKETMENIASFMLLDHAPKVGNTPNR